MVDDGSPDNSGIICDKYSAIDDRIIVVHKKNGGASDARNTGLEKATGEFVCFADSDDIISSSYVSQLYQDLSSTKSADLVIQGFIQRWADREKIYESFSGIYNLGCGELDRLFADICINDYSGPYCKLFRKNILDENRIRFGTDIIYAEDFDFLLRYIPHTRTIVTTNTTNYVYLMHNGSVSSKIYPFEKELSGMRRLDDAFSGIYKICNSEIFAGNRKLSIANYFSRLITSNYFSSYNRCERKNNLSSIDDNLVQGIVVICKRETLFMNLIGYLLQNKNFCVLDLILYMRFRLLK